MSLAFCRPHNLDCSDHSQRPRGISDCRTLRDAAPSAPVALGFCKPASRNECRDGDRPEAVLSPNMRCSESRRQLWGRRSPGKSEFPASVLLPQNSAASRSCLSSWLASDGSALHNSGRSFLSREGLSRADSHNGKDDCKSADSCTSGQIASGNEDIARRRSPIRIWSARTYPLPTTKNG